MDELLRSCFLLARDMILSNTMSLDHEAQIISESFDISVPFARYHLSQLCTQKVTDTYKPKRAFWFPDCDRDTLD